MDKGKKSNEGEMGSGDSDDEFYNVKLPYTPTVATDTPTEKLEVKKVYSPSRTKVKYDYKFDSSSDDESENGSSQKDCRAKFREPSENNSGEKLTCKQEKSSKESSNLPQNTYRVVEKINEELKNMKNANAKNMSDKTENIATSQNHITTPMPSGGNNARSQIGVVPPVVVVPPMVVPQTPVMNMGPMIVPSPVGMGGQNILPSHVMGMTGNMLRAPPSMGGIMTNPSSAMPNNMIGMNTVQSQMAGMMGMQSSIMGLTGNTIGGQGNVMGLQTGMINPAMGRMNMTMQGNMMRMAAAGNSMLRMQRSGGGVMGDQSSNNIMRISRPGGSVMGITRPMNVSGSVSNMLGMQTSGNGVMANPGGMVVNPGNVINNPMVGNAGLMVMGGVMSNMGAPNVVGGAQTNMIPNPGNVIINNNMVRMIGTSQGNPPVRPVPPPPFLNLRNRPPAPGSFKWQASPRTPGTLPSTGSPTNSGSATCLNVPSPTSSPVDRGNGQFDGDELSRDDKDKSLSDRSSTLETDESQSPPRELPNTFKNDGSFMEMFKRMKDEKNQELSSKSLITARNKLDLFFVAFCKLLSKILI